MHERYLGDSFDIVKRFWRQLLSPIAPVFAHPRFILAALQGAFTRLTEIPIWDEGDKTGKDYALLLDPHTGIPLPDAAMNELRISHAPITFIAGLFNDASLQFIICFDQTADRQHDLCIADQRDANQQ